MVEGDEPPSAVARPQVRVLLINADVASAVPLAEALRRVRFDVTMVADGVISLRAAMDADLILVDLGAADVARAELCRRLRRALDMPIVGLVAGGESDRAQILDFGADDCVSKPFGVAELVARMGAVLRRYPFRHVERFTEPVQEVDGLRIDHRTRSVRVYGVEVALTRKEFDLLAILARHAGAVVMREQIMETVWGVRQTWGSTKTLDVHVASLRRKLDEPSRIVTLRRIGYRLNVNV